LWIEICLEEFDFNAPASGCGQRIFGDEGGEVLHPKKPWDDISALAVEK
jgi:hypothetical protein